MLSWSTEELSKWLHNTGQFSYSGQLLGGVHRAGTTGEEVVRTFHRADRTRTMRTLRCDMSDEEGQVFYNLLRNVIDAAGVSAVMGYRYYLCPDCTQSLLLPG